MVGGSMRGASVFVCAWGRGSKRARKQRYKEDGVFFFPLPSHNDLRGPSRASYFVLGLHPQTRLRPTRLRIHFAHSTSRSLLKAAASCRDQRAASKLSFFIYLNPAARVLAVALLPLHPPQNARPLVHLRRHDQVLPQRWQHADG